SAGTLAEGAQLHFERIPARLACRDCGTEYSLEGRALTACPQCDSIRVDILAGNEFRLESISVETEPPL
ncbi:MAG: hydrogenase maturation nickel metallochaperone HypA, partial [Anaerolineales bacterium]|nr:hydrogenase maturation nickel metallochaperone HypA [Anaerolineales bacterium]